jgi:predicted MFS family arabinose efflux permease
MSATPTAGYLGLLRHNRDFRLLYLGALISLGGDWFLTVALLDLVLTLTGSATLASVMLLCQSLPIFFVTPLAGSLVDKVDRRKLMIGVDLIRAAACLLPLFARSATLLPFAYAGVVIIAVGAAYFEPAAQAALPNVVAEEDLGRANVLMGATWGTMLAVGAGLGGLVTMRFGRDTSFVVDSVSFLASAFILWRIRARFSERRDADHQHPPLGEAIRETVRYTRKHPRVLALLTAKGGYGMGAGVVAMVSVFGKEVFHSGAFGIGVLYAARGIGALTGPFLVRAIGGKSDLQYRLISLATLVFGLGYMGLALSHSLWIGALAVGIAHLGGGAQWLTSTFGLQKEVPDRVRGRIFAADYGLVTLTMSISSIAAGVMSDHLGAPTATIITASLSVLWAITWAAWSWKLWKRDGDD